ncbi:hypothetical protein [Deinococcus aquaedulcis]|uniref:hypothetical protein n=1 Tax=Deinococcus aquaedulcis TaxID=2840455 RepID=UPI001C83104A|nr:hypothetical protein [Deinococcus aquaedulcis]
MSRPTLILPPGATFTTDTNAGRTLIILRAGERAGAAALAVPCTPEVLQVAQTRLLTDLATLPLCPAGQVPVVLHQRLPSGWMTLYRRPGARVA